MSSVHIVLVILLLVAVWSFDKWIYGMIKRNEQTRANNKKPPKNDARGKDEQANKPNDHQK